jgi:Ca-activated chloride channel family protein
MLKRLQEIARYADEEIDAVLVDVAPPAGFIERLRRLSQPPRRRLNAEQLAIAASLMFIVGLSYLSSLGFFLMAAYQDRPQTIAALDARQSGSPIGEDRPTTLALAATITVKQIDLDDPVDLSRDPLAIELAVMPGDQPTQSPVPFAMPGIDEMAPAVSVFVNSRINDQVLGAMHTDQENPELLKLPGVVPRGMDFPKENGFDAVFLFNKRTLPANDLARYPRLRQTRIPLDVAPESYQLVKHYIAEGELPPSDVVRTEEFLAAMPYGFTAARDRLKLHIAGGPSPLGNQPGLHMLQIGLQAGEVSDQPRKSPRHLVVLVDVSRSMQASGRLENVQHGLRQLVRRLARHDRLSLVSFSEHAEVLIEDAGAQHAESLYQAIDALQIRGGTNIAVGLQAGDRVAADWAWIDGRDQRVLLVTDGLHELDGAAAEAIREWLRDPGSRAASLSVLDASMSPNGPEVDFTLRRAQSINDFGWLLREELTDQSQLVARDAELMIRFNPKSVHYYRLLGHEPTLLTDSPRGDVHVNETNVGMFELQFVAKPEPLVAEVFLSWIDPQTGRRQQTTQKITRGAFAKELAASPPAFQLGVLASETAELLRQSPFRLGFKYETLRELAAQTSPAVQSNPGFHDLMALVRAAQHARRGPTP